LVKQSGKHPRHGETIAQFAVPVKPFLRFRQDPVRMIRFLKFQARFGFTIDPDTQIALLECRSEIVKSSDYVVDLGPEGGVLGGKVVAKGTPEQVAKTKTHTAKYLKRSLSK